MDKTNQNFLKTLIDLKRSFIDNPGNGLALRMHFTKKYRGNTDSLNRAFEVIDLVEKIVELESDYSDFKEQFLELSIRHPEEITFFLNHFYGMAKTEGEKNNIDILRKHVLKINSFNGGEHVNQ